MNNITLTLLTDDDREQFILDNQRAFKYGAMEEFGMRDDHLEEDGEIISRATIERCIATGAAYRIREDGKPVGGMVLQIDRKTQHNHLDLLFVNPEAHSKGIGFAAWQEAERLYPETQVWETCTPYFEERNIHFYVNKCGFHIVEFFNRKHPDPCDPETGEEEDYAEGGGMFRFEKVMPQPQPARAQQAPSSVTLDTWRLTLRACRVTDAADVYEYLRVPQSSCFACMKLDTLEDAEAEMQRRMTESEYYFAIVLKETGKVIGEIFSGPECDANDILGMADTYSPCWMLNRAYQGKGYMYEAAKAYFNYLFREKNARRIYTYVEDSNIPSRRLCEKLGMRREGLFLEMCAFVRALDGKPHYENTMQYAILRKEWS